MNVPIWIWILVAIILVLLIAGMLGANISVS